MSSDWWSTIEMAVARLRRGSPVPLEGASGPELTELQAWAGNLPSAYLAFLAAVGRHSGDFLRGSDFLIERLTSLQTEARALLREDPAPAFPDDAFVFCAHQGYQFLFFRLSEGPDPPVLHYLEGVRDFRVVAASFSAWFAQTVQDEGY